MTEGNPSPLSACVEPPAGQAGSDRLATPRRVESIPLRPARGETFEIHAPNGHPAYTHYLFRFPAKFHPPVVSWALNTYGCPGMPVLDPFTGSGTVQVEAMVRSMPSVGVDIDPLACFVTRAKTTPLPPDELSASLGRIEAHLAPFRRSQDELAQLALVDLTEEEFEGAIGVLAYPRIPNLNHWFRRYVVLDLARLIWAVEVSQLRPKVSAFFRACIASIIRRVSNADPYPVSALEVSSVQASRNRERVIDVFGAFQERAPRHIGAMATMYSKWRSLASPREARTVQGDTLDLHAVLQDAGLGDSFPLVVTSPPYCTAVNYSRRHKLEMYWLGFVGSREEHVGLSHVYLGRRWVRVKDWEACPDFGIKALDETLVEIEELNRARARALRHYFWSMSRAFAEIGNVMGPGATFICATGDSVSCGTQVETTRFLSELADDRFVLRNHFSYVLRNRYMQYPLRNGVGIRKEHILVFERRSL